MGCELVFKGISTDGRDYHTEMNSKIFKKWVNEQLESALPEKSLIIMDNAS
jgi:transposase